MRKWAIVAAAVAAGAGAAQGQELRAEMYLITPGAADQPIGPVLITSGSAGTKFVADLHGPAARRSTASTSTRTATAAPAPDPPATMAPGMAAGRTTIRAPAPITAPRATGIWATCPS